VGGVAECFIEKSQGVILAFATYLTI
jgi:hypothetical protein